MVLQVGIVGIAFDCVHEATKELAKWLDAILPKSNDWWERRVLDKLNGIERQKAIDNGYNSLTQFDLLALVRIAKGNLCVMKNNSDFSLKIKDSFDCLYYIRAFYAHIIAEKPNTNAVIWGLLHIREFYELIACAPEQIQKIDNAIDYIKANYKPSKITKQIEEANRQGMGLKTDDTFYADTHAALLNKLLNKQLKSWMKCRYDLHNGYKIWMIRLDGKQSKDGWTNTINDNVSEVVEDYTGKPELKLQTHDEMPNEIRLIFGIYNTSKNERYYVFHGVYALDISSDLNYRKWKKLSDSYELVL